MSSSRESLMGEWQRVAEILDSEVKENPRGIHLIGHDRAGQTISLWVLEVTPMAELCDVDLLNEQGTINGRLRLVNQHLTPQEDPGTKTWVITGVDGSFLKIGPDFVASIHHANAV